MHQPIPTRAPPSCTSIPDDTRTLVDLLGGGPLSESAAGVQRLFGVAMEVPIEAESGHAGSTIGDARLQ